MNKNYLTFLILALVLLLQITTSTTVWATVVLGDDVDFDFGSDWDSGSSWDSDWDSGSSWDSDWDSGSDWNSGSTSGISRNRGNTSYNKGYSVVSLVIGVIILSVVSNMKKQTRKSASRRASTTRTHTPPVAQKPNKASLEALKKQDANFSAADIEAKVKNWVLQFEQSWCAGDMAACRPFISDGLYHTYQSQLSMMKTNGEASRTEDLAVLNCELESFKKDGDKEYLNVRLRVKKRTYKVDIHNPSKVIKGDKSVTYHLEYRWQLMRSAGSISDNAGVRVMECPNCGAQTSVNQSGRCDYCGSTLTTESFDWVLNKVDKLGQKSYR